MFAFEKPDAAKAGENLGVLSSVFGKGGFVLVDLVNCGHCVTHATKTYSLDSSRILLQLTIDMS